MRLLAQRIKHRALFIAKCPQLVDVRLNAPVLCVANGIPQLATVDLGQRGLRRWRALGANLHVLSAGATANGENDR